MNNSTREKLGKVCDVMASGGYSLIDPEYGNREPSESVRNSRLYKIGEILSTGGLSLVFKRHVETPTITEIPPPDSEL